MGCRNDRFLWKTTQFYISWCYNMAWKLSSVFGNYCTCSEVTSDKEKIVQPDSDLLLPGGFNGRYCMSKWKLDLEKNKIIDVSIGVCIPSSCAAEEFLKFLADNNSFIVPPIVGSLTPVSIKCKSDEIPWEAKDIVVLFLYCLFGVFLVAGTLFDIIKRWKSSDLPVIIQSSAQQEPITRDKEDLPTTEKSAAHDGEPTSEPRKTDNLTYGTNETKSSNLLIDLNNKSSWMEGNQAKFLMCFSVYTNGARILDTTPGKGQLNCLHGIRFLTMSWVILGHTYRFSMQVVGNVLEAVKDKDSFAFTAVSNFSFSVDSFFLLSGLLLAYLFFKDSVGNRKTVSYWVHFYIHRIWRLTPVYMMVLAFDAVLWKHLSSGPFWSEDGYDGEKCKKNWWYNLLYINNFNKQGEQCLGPTWYLANDMQMYLVSPIFLVSIFYQPLFGIILTCASILSSSTITGLLSIKYGFFASPPRGGQSGPNEQLKLAALIEAYFNTIYQKPWCRIGAYLVGILLGYILYRLEKKKNFLNKWLVLVGWLLATGICMCILYGMYHANPGVKVSAFYFSVSRTMWAVGLAWLIFACVTGHGGFINTILSWGFWIPLSRLSYCAYLIHPLILFWYFQSRNSLLYFSHETMVSCFTAFLVWSYGIALMVSLAFEVPMMGLEKLILKRGSRQTR
ncbi:nose resistant to fluoxetine protein 6-like isoform X1 [Tachypleus tridentatus]|uniref:nose resistant to fluoxetine protein 6-like isoform X1 n=1 Tax=Tachypleus tridentatus TaxID=6853 RepID=UPI003FD3285B